MYDDSATKELILGALTMALVADKPLRFIKKRQRQFILPDPKKVNGPEFNQLAKAFEGPITGYIPGTKLLWTAALELNIQYLLDKPLLQLMPTIIVARTSDINEKKLVAPFVKEATARWFNPKFDSILNGWLKTLFGDEKKMEFTSYPFSTAGVNPKFQISQTTAFTRSK
jgi:hypothetical protein